MSFEVHSYHINVDVGDCAIHVLASAPASGSTKPTPVSAVLIDAGYKRHGGFWLDHFCKDYLNDKYAWVGGSVKFDSVVVTHWDGDHYGGILDLLTDDFDDQAKEALAAGTLPGTVEGARTFIHKLRCRWFKYNDKQAPLTCFYAPYWKSQEFMGASGYPNTNLERVDPVPPSTNATLSANFKLKTGQNKKVVSLDDWAKNVAILRTTVDEVLGIDLFSDKKMYTGTAVEHVVSPDVVSDYIVSSGHNRPVLFCIRAMKSQVGENFDNYKITWNTSNKLSPYFTMQRKTSLIVPGITTINNQASIAATVIWPTVGSTKGRLTHYTAGDLGNEDELLTLYWTMKQGGTAGVRVANRCPAMKLSHHGKNCTFIPPQVYV